MLKRYAREQMSEIWSEEAKFQKLLDVEIAGVKAWCELGVIPNEAKDKIIANAKFNIDRINEIEADVKHDIIAFLTCVSENLGDEGRFLHLGMTSSDAIDTALNLQIKSSLELILCDLGEVLNTLKNSAIKYKNTPMIGRSHGIHGEIITFGFVMLNFYDELRRTARNLNNALNEISVGMFSGAMGNFAHSSIEFQDLACKFLGLKSTKISTQVISRDHHAQVILSMGLLASIIEKIAIEIRHLQRTEVLEVSEFFDINQKGSSAMPHKKNPVLSENLTGLCRIIRSYCIPALEDVSLWHQRDISHSSVERFIMPDCFITMDFMLHRLNSLLKNLIVYEKNMLKNINLTGGLIFSQRILLKLVELGISRELAYKIVQRNSMKVWDEISQNKNFIDDECLFYKFLSKDEELLKFINVSDLKALFDYKYYMQNIDEIYERVLDK